MDWVAVGGRIRRQREFLGYTREKLAELLDVTPKFCSDIELGIKGMSVPTLCRVSEVLCLSTDYILFGTEKHSEGDSIRLMLQRCPASKLPYVETILKTTLLALSDERGQPVG